MPMAEFLLTSSSSVISTAKSETYPDCPSLFYPFTFLTDFEDSTLIFFVPPATGFPFCASLPAV
jgi:hypothetical protein